MAKRFTDTEIWNDPWFRTLPCRYKSFWNYICDRCDIAGIWKVDIDLASIYISERIDQQEALTLFNAGSEGNERILVLNNGSKWLILKFVKFQYGNLNPNVRLHQSVINILKENNCYERVRKGLVKRVVKERVTKELGKGYETPKDKDKVKDRDKDKDKDKGKKRGVGEEKPGYQPFVDHALASYRAKKGVGMQFGDREGKIVKGLLKNYTLSELQALWDLFLGRSWDWMDKAGKQVRVPHDMAVFWEKAKVLVDDPGFKSKVSAYEAKIPRNEANVSKLEKLIQTSQKPEPKEPGFQEKKLAALKVLGQVKG